MISYQIPHELEYHTGKFPRKALQEIIDNQEEMIPELLKVIEYATQNFDELLEDYDYMAHMYALYLLAQFRETRAYPLIIELFSTPGEDIGDFTGDLITEDLNRILASVYDGDIEPIKALAENEQANEYVRSAALYTLLNLYVHGDITRGEVLDYLKSLFDKLPRDGHYIWSSLVYISTELYLVELHNDMKQAFADDMIEPMLMDLKHVEETFQRDKEDVLQELKTHWHYTLIDNTITEMEKWAAFQPPKPIKPIKMIKKDTGQVIREGRKIGRNEPCPCGSGLKYKKCCGKRG